MFLINIPGDFSGGQSGTTSDTDVPFAFVSEKIMYYGSVFYVQVSGW